MIVLITCVSVALMGASLVAGPWILTRLPPDYFQQEKPHLLIRLRTATPGKALGLIAKNVAGAAILIAGVVMLALPGQGLLTILLAFVLIDFPRKFELERWLMSRGKILASINWLRRRSGRTEIVID